MSALPPLAKDYSPRRDVGPRGQKRFIYFTFGMCIGAVITALIMLFL